ncbi:hypothetical protein OG470_22190 [Micromonospora sp. NBC_00389]|uniref:hypothetical protein n=1 Tax=Micromonospora sp. NBC_00389 TaxID=2903586 RepID=UPI002E1D075F
MTGRFARHEGHFDPGQRVANLLMVGLFVALIGSGIGLVLVTGGPWFVWLQRVHRWATYLITPVLIGHIVIAAGLPPGYRGVARAMHLGGRLPLQVAQRLWPGWLDRQREPTMTAEPPCPFTTSVASLLIGALGPLERHEFETHLRQCPMCLEELILLAPLPGLLHRATPPELCPRWEP